MNISAIGQLVHARRSALGLSQARLATMSGLSRATVNQLEGGTLVDLGVAKLITLLDLVGVHLDVTAFQGHKSALQSVSRSASVSYKTTLDPAEFATALIDGVLPAQLTPHIATLLDEAPMALIVAAVEEVAANSSTPPKLLWKHLFHWARELQSPRGVWA
jgi:transcriptional regulator with XRE-family HTH domain